MKLAKKLNTYCHVKNTIFIILLFMCFSGMSQNISELTNQGKLEDIKKLINSDKTLINLKDNEGDIPLCTSIARGYTKISLFFIENGATINNQNQDGYSPLHWAALRGDSIITKVLIGNGANLELETTSKNTALHFAAARGHKGVLKLLVKNGADLEKCDSYKRTPLLIGTRERGGIETVKILVEAGANINATDFFGDTPLSLAAWRGFEKIVNYLLEKEAQFSINGAEGIKLLRYATDKQLWKFYNALIKKGGEKFLSDLKKQPVLHWAAMGGSVKITADLIDKNMPVNATDVYHWAPLHYASYFGRLEVAKLLLEEGAELNTKTPIGETPLYLAQLENNEEVVDFLVSVGAEKTRDNSTQISGAFWGQKNPGKNLELFSPGIVSRLKCGHSNIAFSPDGTEAFWTEWILSDVGYSSGNTIWHSKIKKGFWSLPEKFLSKGDTPFFSFDGSKIFIFTTNTLPPENIETRGIYYYERKGDELKGPKLLNFDVNTTGLYWQFSFDKNENIYFSTDEGLFRALKKDGEYLEKENLAHIFHSDYRGGAPFISPDGDYIIFSSRVLEPSFGSLDLYIGFKKADNTWTKPINMGSTINSEASESLPIVSSNGKYLFLRTSRKGVNGIYWIDTKIIEDLKPKNIIQ